MDINSQTFSEQYIPKVISAINGLDCVGASEVVGEQLTVAYAFTHKYKTCLDDGRELEQRRLVLICEDGLVVATTSPSAIHCCENISGMLGLPTPEKKWLVTVTEKKTKRGFKTLIIAPYSK